MRRIADTRLAAISQNANLVELSKAHIAAVNRRRRIYVNNDVGWCLDEGNIAAYPSKTIPELQYPTRLR